MDFVEDRAAVSESDFRTYGKFMVTNFSVDECQGSPNNGTINSFSTVVVHPRAANTYFLGHEVNRSTVMAKHFYGSGKWGGSRKAQDRKFHSTSCHSSVLSTQCWMNPRADNGSIRTWSGSTHPKYWERNTQSGEFC